MQKMDRWGLALTIFALLALATENIMNMLMIERFGTLRHHHQIETELDDVGLSGPYVDALKSLLAISVSFQVIYVLLFVLNQYQHRIKLNRSQQVFVMVLLVTFLLGWTLAGLDFHLFEKYTQIDDLTLSPTNPPFGDNYKLRGLYGWSLLGVNVASMVMVMVSSVSLVHVWQHRKKEDLMTPESQSELFL